MPMLGARGEHRSLLCAVHGYEFETIRKVKVAKPGNLSITDACAYMHTSEKEMQRSERKRCRDRRKRCRAAKLYARASAEHRMLFCAVHGYEFQTIRKVKVANPGNPSVTEACTCMHTLEKEMERWEGYFKSPNPFQA